MTQELGILALIKRGVCVLTANGDDLTDSSDLSRKMMRQIAGSFAEYEKARLVAKFKAARERERLTTGNCEGRKSHAEINPEMVQIAKGLCRSKRGNSLRAIAADLASGATSTSTAGTAAWFQASSIEATILSFRLRARQGFAARCRDCSGSWPSRPGGLVPFTAFGSIAGSSRHA